VVTHTAAIRDLFENKRQFPHFQNYLKGLTVLSNKSMANITRCILDSADKKICKQLLGLDEYRMRSAEAIRKHACPVFMAYSLIVFCLV
jgi:hypothetical protein